MIHGLARFQLLLFERLLADLTTGLRCGFVSAPREQLIAVGPWARIFWLRAARARGNPAYP
jgi:hypothetical protein